IGTDGMHAEVIPEQKTEIVGRFRSEGRIVSMAGDGINDAPALATAEVGIAMGSGTDVAIESVDIVLVKGDLQGIVRARRLSRATMRNIRQNLFWAFGYNVLGVPIAAGVLYPVSGLLLSPMIASAAMSFSSVSVIGNALRLRRRRCRRGRRRGPRCAGRARRRSPPAARCRAECRRKRTRCAFRSDKARGPRARRRALRVMGSVRTVRLRPGALARTVPGDLG